MKKIILALLILLNIMVGFNVIKVKAAETFRVHFYNSDNWNAVYVYMWRETPKGDQQIGVAWPGVKITQEGDSNWWYIDLDLEIGDHVIFNSANQKPQAPDLVISEKTEMFVCKIANKESNTLILYENKEAVEEAISLLEPIDPNTKSRIWFYNSQGWPKVYIYAYGGSFENEATGPWPGKLAIRDEKTHWYYFDVNSALPIHVIFSDGSDQNKSEAYVTNKIYMTIGNDKTYQSKQEAEATITEVLPIKEDEVTDPVEIENRYNATTTVVDYFINDINDNVYTMSIIVITSLLGLFSLILLLGLIIYKMNNELFLKIGVIKWLLKQAKN
jgi:hypothetical protein